MSEFRLGQHDASIESLRYDMKGVRADLADIKRFIAAREGERRIVIIVTSAVSAFLASVFTVGLRVFEFVIARIS